MNEEFMVGSRYVVGRKCEGGGFDAVVIHGPHVCGRDVVVTFSYGRNIEALRGEPFDVVIKPLTIVSRDLCCLAKHASGAECVHQTRRAGALPIDFTGEAEHTGPHFHPAVGEWSDP